ncbi:MAG: NADPH-dependent glutamate synthase [Clostridia bacterium]|nr:NADPH-dependent glutamate synthase [Clostridia bacterium]
MLNIVLIKLYLFIKEKKYFEALASIKKTSNLPSICGRVCPQESQCEKYCIRGIKSEPVAIGTLERFVADRFLNEDIEVKPVEKIGKKVAVVGSGPSGLTLAGDLAAAGVDVTIFEAFHEAGGVLVYGIPEFRLPKAIVKKEVENLKKMGVKVELNTVVGKTVYLSELREEYDAVYICNGAGLPMFLGIPGESLNGVMSANEFLTRVNLMKAYKPNSPTPVKIGKKVAVIGAGNVAMDAARTAMRLGAEEVYVVYRRGEEEVPARKEEVRHAKEEGVEFRLLTNPIRIEGEAGKVTKMVCVKMELGEPDASGRRSPKAIPGSEYDLECDTVIVSLGTKANPIVTESAPELSVTNRGLIIVDDENRTNLPDVYSGGDSVTGAATVILAMGAGKNAAKAILKMFNK